MSLALIQADCKSVLGTLTNLNNDELDMILNDEDKIQEIFDKVEQVSAMRCLSFKSKL